MKLLKFLTLTTAALLLFSSCAGETPEGSAETTTAETEQTAEIYTVASPGVCDYTFIRADVMGSDALKKTVDLRRSITVCCTKDRTYACRVEAILKIVLNKLICCRNNDCTNLMKSKN